MSGQRLTDKIKRQKWVASLNVGDSVVINGWGGEVLGVGKVLQSPSSQYLLIGYPDDKAKGRFCRRTGIALHPDNFDLLHPAANLDENDVCDIQDGGPI